MHGLVYLVTNKTNGKEYVGYTFKTLSGRWSEHKSDAKRGKGTLLHRAIRKYGSECFRIEIIEEIQGSRMDLAQAEIRHIAARGSLVPHGYNLTEGGEGVDFSVPEVRARHKASQQRKTQNPLWQAANREQLRRQHADPVWQTASAEGRKRAWAANSANAVARDAILPEEEREQRARRRERDRLRKISKRAQWSHP